MYCKVNILSFECLYPSHDFFIIFLYVGSVLTPYYSEETVYSKNDLEVDNEDGVSILYYLQKIFPG